jgi:apolipoprotein N-acyltransferase
MAEPARPELVVWPEATFPGVFRQPRSKLQLGRANKFDRQVLRHHTPIVFGGYDLEEIDGRSTLFNSLFAITPSYARAGGLGSVQRYHKHELLPFAETIPGLSRADWLRAILPGLALFGRGAGAGVLPIVTPSGETVRLSPIICSESLQTGHVLEGVREGGDVIVNIGSDGWFGDRGEPQLHLAIARFRSVETRRSQIRAANTGISALIGPDGAIDRATTIGESGVLRGEVPIVSGPGTLLLSWGDWFGPVSLAVSAILLGLLLGSGRIAARAADPSSGSDAIDGATDAR